MLSQVWWCTPVLPALGRLRQEDCEFWASVSYIERFCLKAKKKIKLNSLSLRKSFNFHQRENLEFYLISHTKIWNFCYASTIKGKPETASRK
jgi:hypothetical protein